MDIKAIVGETTEYEKKVIVDFKDPRNWMKSISAFANGAGGSIIFGIADKTEDIVGLADAQSDADQVSIYIRDRIDPIPPFNLRFATEDKKILIILDVKPGSETPYYYV